MIGVYCLINLRSYRSNWCRCGYATQTQFRTLREENLLTMNFLRSMSNQCNFPRNGNSWELILLFRKFIAISSKMNGMDWFAESSFCWKLHANCVSRLWEVRKLSEKHLSTIANILAMQEINKNRPKISRRCKVKATPDQTRPIIPPKVRCQSSTP